MWRQPVERKGAEPDADYIGFVERAVDKVTRSRVDRRFSLALSYETILTR